MSRQPASLRRVRNLKIIVTGGGTGGHIYPAIALAKGLRERVLDLEVLYIGTREGMEAKLVPDHGIPFQGISGRGWSRKWGKDTWVTVESNLKALWETKRILKEFKPDLVVGTGGYVSGPVVLTAATFGIPTLLHEQNALPGKTNQLLSHLVKKVMVTFPGSATHFHNKEKIEVVGLPVRGEVGKIPRKSGAQVFGVDPAKKTILVTGGSRGALRINQAMIYLLKKLTEEPQLQLIWATGTVGFESVRREIDEQGLSLECSNWRILEYISEMPAALACSDLCICRAGATTLAELSEAGKASILIPYPFAAENHQEYNARVFEQAGAAQLILDRELDGPLLWQSVEKTIGNPFKLEEMSVRAREVFQPGALDRMIGICIQTAWR